MTQNHSSPATGASQSRRPRRNWQKRFLEVLAQTSNVTKSAEEAGIAASTAYKLRSTNAEFAQAWLAALWEGYIHLEMEVLRRLRAGEQKSDDGEKYDFVNAIRLLSAHRDTAARAQANERNVSVAEIRSSIDRKVEEIRLKVMKEKAKEHSEL